MIGNIILYATDFLVFVTWCICLRQHVRRHVRTLVSTFTHFTVILCLVEFCSLLVLRCLVEQSPRSCRRADTCLSHIAGSWQVAYLDATLCRSSLLMASLVELVSYIYSQAWFCWNLSSYLLHNNSFSTIAILNIRRICCIRHDIDNK
jgi:hypothetical protein